AATAFCSLSKSLLSSLSLILFKLSSRAHLLFDFTLKEGAVRILLAMPTTSVRESFDSLFCFDRIRLERRSVIDKG
ncbi:MAG: hypothetical protein ACK53Y_17495, partial [bacterium]